MEIGFYLRFVIVNCFQGVAGKQRELWLSSACCGGSSQSRRNKNFAHILVYFHFYIFLLIWQTVTTDWAALNWAHTVSIPSINLDDRYGRLTSDIGGLFWAVTVQRLTLHHELLCCYSVCWTIREDVTSQKDAIWFVIEDICTIYSWRYY